MGRGLEQGGETVEGILHEINSVLAEAQKTAERIQAKDRELRADIAGDPKTEALAPELDGIMREMQAASSFIKHEN